MEKASGKTATNGHASNGTLKDQVAGPQLPVQADFSTPKTSLVGAPGQEKVTVPRRFTKAGINPLDVVKYAKRKSVIADPDGTVVFAMDDAEVPEDWSQLATDVAVSKYFRKAGVPVTGHEKSVRQLVERVAKTLRKAGEEQGLLASKEIADTFEDELSYMLIHQIGAFNSPVWFNCGLWHQYGIEGSGGNFAWDEKLNKVVETANAYQRPQVSACFIQSVDDDLSSIFDLVKNESRVFKYGSGTGTNFSKLRGDMEKLSGGGLSSGLMSFLEVLDRGAGATKSGGTTRRAAKMVVVDIDHPEVDKFITWKKREERKVAALIQAGYASDFNGEAYRTVAGQNSNNSVRVTDAFMKAVENDEDWTTTFRTTGGAYKTYKARELWRMMADASWHCADPGLQFDDTINNWHTCKATDRIYASNPCSEYMFLDDTACNLASINLLKFLDEEGKFDTEGFRHACRVFFLAQEIAVDLASYPTAKIAENSHKYRTLGLGFANLGTLLMVKGMPYDSDAGRDIAAAITSLMTGEAYALSAEMSAVKGPFPGHKPNAASMLGVIKMHTDAAYAIPPMHVPEDLIEAARECWDRAYQLGEKWGFRNAQATVLAPTGTIGLLMDCDTTGVEPDFALVKFKKLAGGGYWKIVNQSVPRALKALGYDAATIDGIIRYAIGTCSLDGAPHINRASLAAKGLLPDELASVERALKGALDLKSAFAPHIVGAVALERLGVPEKDRKNFKFNLLTFLGFTQKEINEANDVICGRQTVEGAPGIKPQHLPVFDCANRCGPHGQRYIEPMGHIRMMGAVQPFLSGAISKTINLPKDATIEDVEAIHLQSWKLGLKAIALYRDGSKLSQPLNVKEKDKEDKKEEAKPAAPAPVPVAAAPVAAPTKKKVVGFSPPPLERHRLPAKRVGVTQEAKIGGLKIFLRTGEYNDGKLGEIFIDMHKEGAAYRSLLNCFSMLTSIALQYGVPLDVLVDQFVFTRFEPQGPVTGHERVKFATSVIDYIFRSLAVEYLGREDLAHVPASEQVESNQSATVDSPALRAAAAATTSTVESAAAAPKAVAAAEPEKAARGGSAQDALLGELSGDAPFCDTCGHITVRNGACFKCLNCGTSMGCS
jgi:ribonucleoside-diphosphate reductase alpha chain